MPSQSQPEAVTAQGLGLTVLVLSKQLFLAVGYYMLDAGVATAALWVVRSTMPACRLQELGFLNLEELWWCAKQAGAVTAACFARF